MEIEGEKKTPEPQYSITLKFENKREASIFQAMMHNAWKGKECFPEYYSHTKNMGKKILDKCVKLWK